MTYSIVYSNKFKKSLKKCFKRAWIWGSYVLY